MRLIDADALLKKLGNNSWDIDEWELPHEQVSTGLMANALDRETVEEMPTVDAVPVRHGKWTPHEEMSDEWNCSETWYRCQCGYDTRRKTPYCPMCGARMDKDD